MGSESTERPSGEVPFRFSPLARLSVVVHHGPVADRVVEHDVRVRRGHDAYGAGAEIGREGRVRRQVEPAQVDVEQPAVHRHRLDRELGDAGVADLVGELARRDGYRQTEDDHQQQQTDGQDAAGPAEPGRRHQGETDDQQRRGGVDQRSDGRPQRVGDGQTEQHQAEHQHRREPQPACRQRRAWVRRLGAAAALTGAASV